MRITTLYVCAFINSILEAVGKRSLSDVKYAVGNGSQKELNWKRESQIVPPHTRDILRLNSFANKTVNDFGIFARKLHKNAMALDCLGVAHDIFTDLNASHLPS